MKKRVLSVLMAVTMLVELIPAYPNDYKKYLVI